MTVITTEHNEMSLTELEYELDGLIEIKERLLDEEDESLDDGVDEVIGRLLAAMMKEV